jgi:hypothetical protein
MAGLVPAIHVLGRGVKDVDARDKPAHDELKGLFTEAIPVPRRAAGGGWCPVAA